MRLAAVLVFAAALTVASVVRLALLARREEIHIMQLVGAPIAYIRGPFVVEGLIEGGLGALVAIVVLWIAFLMMKSRADAWFCRRNRSRVAGVPLAVGDGDVARCGDGGRIDRRADRRAKHARSPRLKFVDSLMARFVDWDHALMTHSKVRPRANLTDFYREEFLKHRRCLEQQREYYSDSAITSVEAALTRIISQIENLSTKEDADQVVSRLLRKLNVVTGLSGWTDPTNVH